jgi:Mrp family chromosome partitioning ATPase
LEQVRSMANRVIEAEPAITQLQRKRDVDEASYRYYVSSLEQARVDESVGAGKITNIGVVQTPSPPARDIKELLKPVGAILAFGLFGGLALAFLIEKFLDQSLRRVVDIERLVRLPVFVSVPDLAWKNGNARFAKARKNGNGHSSHNGHTSEAAGAAAANGNGNGNGHAPAVVENLGDIAAWDERHKLRSHYEGLRDRLITYFEVRDLTHKPKLVAVTSCNRGAGVTTMAAGLAATLSETGDGNVLLVDMNLDQGAAHPFYQGKPGCALSEALENETRDPAQVQDNLYLVTAYETKNEKLPRVLPKRFAHLIPRMKSSDYDYIIFDMPPITQTSVTPRLAGFMDMVLVVIESGATGLEIVKRANALLNESRANVAVVLNKHRAYVPARFNQEL